MKLGILKYILVNKIKIAFNNLWKSDIRSDQSAGWINTDFFFLRQFSAKELRHLIITQI
jgi:hypothetical protein